MEKLNVFIKQIDSLRPENVTKAYFSRRTASEKNRYVTHQPKASNEVQYGILDTVFPYILHQLETNEIVDYDPVGAIDGEIEVIDVEKIPLFNEFLSSLNNENLYHEMSSLRIDKIGFYCIAISYNNETMYLFRQFQKLKKIRKGYITRIIEDELNVIDNDFLGIDEYIDIIIYDNKVYLFNHTSLERIFNYKDEFLKKTNEALGELLSKQVISNIEQFADDCKNDVRIMKRFTRIMTTGRLPMFFDNYERVPEIVKELGLDIDFDEDGKLVYRERSQLFHIINLLSDAYFKSLLAERTGIAKIEEEI